MDPRATSRVRDLVLRISNEIAFCVPPDAAKSIQDMTREILSLLPNINAPQPLTAEPE